MVTKNTPYAYMLYTQPLTKIMSENHLDTLADKLPIGRVHSIDTCSATDGPGLRAVVFLQGCPLRCLYCQNPDTWNPKEGKSYSVETILGILEHNRHYFFRSGGGITLSGGEPLLQANFVRELFKACRETGFHTALDTSGIGGEPAAVEHLLEVTDLVMLDIKDPNPETHSALTGHELHEVLPFMEKVLQHKTRLWIRHVLVPGWTMEPASLEKMAVLLAPFWRNIERLEFLGYHQLGLHKWKELGKLSQLEQTPAVSAMQKQEAEALFYSYLQPLTGHSICPAVVPGLK